MKSHKRLGLLHPDGSLTVYPPDIGIEQARCEAMDCDENQDNEAHFTKVVSLRIEDIEALDVPSLKPSKRLIQQLTPKSRSCVIAERRKVRPAAPPLLLQEPIGKRARGVACRRRSLRVKIRPTGDFSHV